MDKLIDEVASRFPADIIKQEREVTRIVWGNTVSVTCKVAGGEETFVADHVIVTCPLGYLKKHHESMFQPPLPKAKCQAIKTISVGRIGKIFLEYEKPFWNRDISEMGLAWSDEEYAEDVGKDWTKRINRFEGCLNSKNTLGCFVACEGAAMMETFSEEEVMGEITRLLRKLLKNPSIPSPIRCVKTKWITDPFTLGVYSSQGESTPVHRRDMATPLDVAGVPRVLFAGEHTDGHFSGYMHGARDSGLREASRLVDFYNKSSKGSIPKSNL